MNLKNYFLLSLLILSVNFFDGKSQTWTDISSAWITSQNLDQTPPTGTWKTYLYGCAGATVNRLTGDLYINIIKYGIWKSSDQGKTYVRIDQNTITGNVSPHGVQVDQDDPKRMAFFSIDGSAGYTPDGINWKKMKDFYRNWDFGAIDWSSPDPKVLMAVSHGSSKYAMLSTNGGNTWNPMSIEVKVSGGMIGIIDSTTFLYSANNGINRSTDQGATWTKVYSTEVRTNVVAMFKGVCYVGTKEGLLVSKDKGLTWQKQGSPIDIIQGPSFGADEKEIVIVNNDGVYISKDAGVTWKLRTKLTRGNTTYISADNYTLTVGHGRYAWDFFSNTCYVAGCTNSAFKKELGPTDTISPSAPTNIKATNITFIGYTVSWTASTDNVGVAYYEVFRGTRSLGTSNTTSLNVTGLSPNTTYAISVKAHDAEGNISAASDTLFVKTLNGLGLKNNQSNFSIYPNPASDYVMIECPERISGSVIIYNASGIVVAKKVIQTNNIMIDVSAFPKGFYLAKVASDHECMTRSFFIQ